MTWTGIIIFTIVICVIARGRVPRTAERVDNMKCNYPECQEGHYPLGYDDDHEVVWGECPCCNGGNWENCPNCTTSFTDPTPATSADDTAAYHGQERAV